MWEARVADLRQKFADRNIQVQKGKAYPVSDVVWTTAGGMQAAHLLLDDVERWVAE